VLYIVLFLFFIIAMVQPNMYALQTLNNTKDDKIAKALYKKESQAKRGGNKNNGRSNKSRCCRSGVMIQGNYQNIIFKQNSQWSFVGDAKTAAIDCPNPILTLGSVQAEWNIEVRTSEGKFYTDKIINITGSDLILSTLGIANGNYFILISHNGKEYASGFEIGPSNDAINQIPVAKKKKN